MKTTSPGQMEYNEKEGDLVISTLQVQVDDVKHVMTKNIDKVLERGERLAVLADRSDDLESAVILQYLSLYAKYSFKQTPQFKQKQKEASNGFSEP